MDIEKLNWLLFSFYMCGFINSIWIVALIRKAIKRKKCTHKNNFIYVENVATTCEKTTTTCMDCGKKITKTDC